MFKNIRTEIYKRARDFSDFMVNRKGKRGPKDLHGKRKRSLYVGLEDTGDWNRPSDASKEDCEELLLDAVFNSRLWRDRLLEGDQELVKALGNWKNRPTLPHPTSPHTEPAG